MIIYLEKSMNLSRLLLLFLFSIGLATSHPLVENPFRDIIAYQYTQQISDFLAIFGNFFWGIFLAPLIGGNRMVQAQLDFNTNPGLHKFLEYTVTDFYLFRMQDEKLIYARNMGYVDSILANYTNVLPERPPE